VTSAEDRESLLAYTEVLGGQVDFLEARLHSERKAMRRLLALDPASKLFALHAGCLLAAWDAEESTPECAACGDRDPDETLRACPACHAGYCEGCQPYLFAKGRTCSDCDAPAPRALELVQ
jgi:hypothetical protein